MSCVEDTKIIVFAEGPQRIWQPRFNSLEGEREQRTQVGGGDRGYQDGQPPPSVPVTSLVGVSVPSLRSVLA